MNVQCICLEELSLVLYYNKLNFGTYEVRLFTRSSWIQTVRLVPSAVEMLSGIGTPQHQEAAAVLEPGSRCWVWQQSRQGDRMQPYSAGGRRQQRGVAAAGDNQQEQYCQTGSWWVSTVLAMQKSWKLKAKITACSAIESPVSAHRWHRLCCQKHHFLAFLYWNLKLSVVMLALTLAHSFSISFFPL